MGVWLQMHKLESYLIAVLMVFLVILLPVAHASSICGLTSTTSAEEGTEFTAVDCSSQSVETHQAIAEEERSIWDVAMPIVLVLVVVVLTVMTFGAGGPLAGGVLAQSGTWAMVGSAGALTTSSAVWAATVNIAAIAAASYGAYAGISAQLDAEKTIVLTAKCDDSITIALNEDDADCSCTIVESNSNPSPTELDNGETFPVKAGITYTMTAVLKKFEWPHTSATCECSATGLITSNNAQTNAQPPPPVLPTAAPINGTPSATACCQTLDGYCLDNYQEDLCTGTVLCGNCADYTQCLDATPSATPGTGQGTFSASQTFANAGDVITFTYYVSDATANTTVTANIKSGGSQIASVMLGDDGSNGDAAANDKTYTAQWTVPAGISGTITWDIIVDYGVNTVTIPNVGSMLILNGQDCTPIGYWNYNASLDIIFMGKNYFDPGNYTPDAASAASRILMADPFLSYAFSDGINFYNVTKMFADPADTTASISNYVTNQCNFLPPGNKQLRIILDQASSQCVQSGNIVQLNPLFTITSGATIDNAILDFCNPAWFNNIYALNPPVPRITTANMTVTNTVVTINFNITDEEEPIAYEVLFEGVSMTGLGGQIASGIQGSYSLNLTTKPDGNYTTEIEATDQQGISAISNTLKITVDTS